MDAFFAPLSSLLGASVDQVKLIACLLLSYPLGSLFIRIPSSQSNAKHYFSIAISLFFLVGVLELYTGFLHLLGSMLGTYVVTKNARSSWMPWIVFAFVMGHLMINHVIRAIYNFSYETVEITGPQMVLTMKLTTFAWNVWDGRRHTGDLDKWQMAKRIENFPSLLEFLGYCFYFPGVLVGPYLEFTDYMALIDESLFKSAEGKNKSGRSVPHGRKRVAYVKMIAGLIYLGLFVVLGGSFYYGITLTPWFAGKPLVYRIGYVQLCGFVERCKYYAIWTLTEGASILTGLGFTGFSPSGESLWEGAANIKILNIELPDNFKGIIDSWNMKANVWLRECVYKRVTPKGKKPGFRSSMITFATSAFWHGIAGGYYLSFLFAGFVTTAARLCRSTFRPLVLPPPGSPDTILKLIYDIIGTAVSIAILNFTAAPFMLLSAENSLLGWQRVGWYGVWMVGGTLVFFYAGGRRALGKMTALVTKEKLSTDGDVAPVRDGALTPTSMSGSFQIPPPLDQVVPPQL